jgi:hypothetical protein
MATPMRASSWSSRVDPVIQRYRQLVPFIGQEDATLVMAAVAQMILAVERAKSAGSNTTAFLADDAILQAGKLLEAVGDQGRREED